MSGRVTKIGAVQPQRNRSEEALVKLEREMGCDFAQLEAVLNVVPCRRYEVYQHLRDTELSIASHRSHLAALSALPSAERLDEVAKLAAELLEVATPAVAKRELAQLIAAFPSASLADPEMFLTTLLYDVLDIGIPDVVLVVACREIRRTHKFVPAISEVLAVAEAISEKWKSLSRLAEMRRISERHFQRALAEAEEKRRRLLKEEEHQRTMQARREESERQKRAGQTGGTA